MLIYYVYNGDTWAIFQVYPQQFGYMKMRVAVDDPGRKASIVSSEQRWKVISTCFHKTGRYYLPVQHKAMTCTE